MSRQVRAPERLLQRLEWTVVRRLDGVLQGNYRSLVRGSGLDLAEIREYQPSDDVRHIDWNVTARQSTTYVRRFHEDREVTVWFLLDLSPSMDFGSGATSKRERLIEIVALLGRVFSRQGNRVGAILYSGGVDYVIRPATGQRHLLSLIDRLTRHPAPETAASTDLAGLLGAAFPVIRRRSVCFIISDFVSEPGWFKPLGMLADRHETTAIRLFDPLETELPDLGLITMQDAETGEQLLVDTHDQGFRIRYAEQVQARTEQITDQLLRSGTDVFELATDDDLFTSVLRFIQMRSGRFSTQAANSTPAPQETAQ